MRKIAANGIAIRYEVRGEGPWLVLSHALATDLSLWDDQVAALAAHFRVLRFDTRGHGGTDAPAGPYDFGLLTADLLALLDALHIERTSFVGISLGGMIGQHLALAAPNRVERLVLTSTTHRYPPEAAGSFRERAALVEREGLESLVTPTLERWFTPPFRAGHPAVLERIAGLIRATPAAGYAGCCHAIPALNTTERLAGIRCPTLVLAGMEDGGTPPALGREIAAAIPGARFEAIDSAAHLCNVEQAAEFNRLLLGFLR